MVAALIVASALVAVIAAIGSGVLSPPHAVATGNGPSPLPTLHMAGVPASTSSSEATEPASTTTVAVTPTTHPAGSPASTAAAASSPGSQTVSAASTGCPAGACVTLDATSATATLQHSGAGVNLLPSSDSDGSRLRSLDTTMYRSAPAVTSLGTYDWTSWDAAVSAGASTTLILSDLWAEHFPHGPPATPWSNWSNYTSWVRSTVEMVLASAQTVNYWDVYNEPGWNNYYSASDFKSETPQDLLQQFLVTYQAIRSIDPLAAIVGPSTGLFTTHPLPVNPLTHEPDMATFLRFAAANGLQLAAVAWHDNGKTPADIYADAETTWSLIRSLPALGHPQMFLDEYGSSLSQPIPGWDVGFLSTIEEAGIGSAVRSCWDACTMATIDGLLVDGGRAETPDYFVRTTYAAMNGTVVAARTSSTTVAALGSLSQSRTQVVALIGRLQGCAVTSWCRTVWHPPGSTPAPPTTVDVSVVVPWTTASVSVNLGYEPFQPGATSSGPIAVHPSGITLRRTGVGSETVSFSIPDFADGSAYNLIVTE
jgi:hypothetical protein